MTIKVYPEISGMGIYRSVFMYKHSRTIISSILILPVWLNSSYKSTQLLQYPLQYHRISISPILESCISLDVVD